MDLVEGDMHIELHEDTSVVAAHCVTQESMHSMGKKSPHHVEQPLKAYLNIDLHEDTAVVTAHCAT
jgi:hypothetical protein